MLENDLTSAIYRSNDSIKNFRIRVKLQRVTSNALLPSLPRLKIQNDLMQLLGEPEEEKKKKKKTKDTDDEEVIISWQEKLFNRIEFNDYSHDPGPHGDIRERRYFEQIRSMKVHGQRPGRIYTYVEGDTYQPIEMVESFLTDSPKEEPNRLTVGMTMMRKRRGISSRDPINYHPTTDDIHLNHFSILPHQTMYIMADLSDRTEQATAQLVLLPQPIEEHILCKIQVFSNGKLVIAPDFNTNKMAYVTETGSFYNEVYQYYLEHASMPMQIDDWKREKTLLDEIYRRQQRQLIESVGKKFECPPSGVLKLNLFGEIISAKNFEYDDMYVYYQLDLPDNWYADKSTILFGYTPTARTTSSSRYDDIVYYSCPFEFEVWYRPPLTADENEFLAMPKMYFHVASQDTWGRYRTEGYTYLDIPTFPGCYDEHLSCWRPQSDSIFDELRRYFIGSSTELDDLSAIAIPHMHQYDKNTKPFSRFGFRTISTGEIHLRLYVVFQSENIAMAYRRHRANPRAAHAEFDSWMSNIHSVLDNFEQAKHRAKEVREVAVQMIDQQATMF